MVTTTRSPVPWRPWLLGWTGMVGLAVANGTLRGAVLMRVLPETRARQVSTASLLAVETALVARLHRRHPVATDAQAWAVGGRGQG